MKNYGVRSVTVLDNYTKKNVECWELYRRRPNRKGDQSSAYFNKETLKQVFVKE